MMYRLTVKVDANVNELKDKVIPVIKDIAGYLKIRGSFIKHYRLTDTVGEGTIIFNPRYANIDAIKNELGANFPEVNMTIEDLPFNPLKKRRRNNGDTREDS